MKVLQRLLAQFAPELGQLTPEVLAEYLTNLGFETEVLAGETPVLDVSITPNRADGMSHLGLARDLFAYLNYKSGKSKPPLFKIHKLSQHLKTLNGLVEFKQPDITISSPTVASQYHALLFENVTIGPSLDWVQEELTLLGIRPINNIVDVTNYMMELFGQPLHAFDADALVDDKLIVRASKKGETLTTLDGTVHTLPEGVVVIEDGEGLVDLAGIRGGANSEIRPTTTRVLLQSAIFDRGRIRRAVNALSYRTVASSRYERGVDPAISEVVLAKATTLPEIRDSNADTSEFGKANIVGKNLHRTAKIKTNTIELDPTRVVRLLGVKVSTKEQERILTNLGCTVAKSGKKLTITPPSWRFDLEIWQDLAEEVARFVGLDDTIPATLLPKIPHALRDSQIEWAERIKDVLVKLGLSEVQTYSFIAKEDLDRFGLESVGELANPLNPTVSFLRPSLLPGLVHVVANNSVYDPILVFEIGHVFDKTSEDIHLGIALAGQNTQKSAWIARIADAFGIDSAKFEGSVTVTELTQVQRDQYKIRKSNVTLLEMPLTALKNARGIPRDYSVPITVTKYRAISKFPPVVRDIALLLDDNVKASDIRLHIQSLDARVETVQLFDEFSSPKLGKGKKSLALHIFYADLEKTMTDNEAAKLHDFVIDSTTTTFSATVR